MASFGNYEMMASLGKLKRSGEIQNDATHEITKSKMSQKRRFLSTGLGLPNLLGLYLDCPNYSYEVKFGPGPGVTSFTWAYIGKIAKSPCT